MKKVLFSSHLANFVKFNKPFMQWFMNQGWEVHYASLDEEPIPCCHKHFKIQFNRSPRSIDNVKAYFQLRKVLQSEQYDIIHCHTPMGGAVTRLAAMSVSKKNGTKVLYTAHGFHFYKGAPIANWLIYYPIEKLLSQWTDCLITINDEDYQIAKRKKFYAGCIKRIDGVGIDLTRFHPVEPSEKSALRKEYGLLDSDFILICVAELNKNKHQKLIIEAMKHIFKKNKATKVVFCGTGGMADSYLKFVRSLQLEKNVLFAGYRTDVDKFYKLADVCVSASYREGLPINIIEGMACGLPVVCTAIRGHLDVVTNGYNGFLLLSQNDSGELAEKILQLHNDKVLIDQIAKNNTIDVQKYDINHAICMMSNIYQKFM